MSYTTKSYSAIMRDLRGMMVGRTELNDVLAGSVMNTLLSAVAMELASSERRLYAIRESFFFRGATGADLDERVAELPSASFSRLTASNGSGSVLTIIRSDLSSALTIPVGSLVASVDGQQYRTAQTVIIPQNEELIENVQIIATTAGKIGNSGVSSITTIISMPADVIQVTNTQPITNGADEETDEQLRRRANLYMQSLTRCTKSALEFLGASFVSSDGERMRFINLYEDPTKPAYSELVVDDGSGLVVGSVSTSGSQVTGTIPVNESLILYHQAPATSDITNANLVVTRNGAPVQIDNSNIISFPERGVVYLKEGAVQAGDTWTIDNYRVYQGFIKELQEEIEGDVNNPALLTGFRAAGTRVVVSLGQPQFVRFDVSLSVEQNTEASLVSGLVRNILVELINGLAPSETLYTSAMIEAARAVSGVKDINIYVTDTDTPYPNQFAATPRSAIRINSTSINITNTARG